MQSRTPESTGPAAGDRIGRWTLEEPLAAGAFGTTWRARRADGRAGALKILAEPPEDELRALASVCHPAVVGVLDGGGEPVPYLVMDLAPGASLGAVLAREGAMPESAPQLAAVLADALAAVHAVGVVHGDIKPDNVIVGPAGQAWLVDFGMAGGHGGTPLYTSPERSVEATAEGDVYALGLVAWELLHGDLPWGSSWGDRGRAAPAPRVGPSWLRRLVARMLDPEPVRRPTAAEVADAVAANGINLPLVDPELLRRRAARTSVPRPGIDEALAAWLDTGGAIAVVGKPRTGRTHALARLATELSARGERWIRWDPGTRMWDPVREALADPRLGEPRPLPVEDDPELRARLAAAELEDRADRLFVLADDAEALDEGSRATLRMLVERGRVHVCVADREAPPWVARAVTLEPLDEAGTAALVRGVLGPAAETGPLVQTTHEVSEGNPGRAVDFLCAALEAGALVSRAHRWLVDDARLAELATAGPPPVEVTFDPEVAAIAAPLGLAGALSKRALADLAGVDDDAVESALQVLAGLGLVAFDGAGVRPAGRTAAATLASQARHPAAVHRRIVDWLLQLEPVPLGRLGWHLVGGDEPALVAAHGPAALRAAIELDPSDAARLGQELARIAPSPAITAARVDALRGAGRIDAALEVGEQALPETISPAHWEVLVALGQVHGSFRDDPDAALACLRRAREVAPDLVPLEIDRVEAEVLLRAGRVEEAARIAAETLASRTEPEDPGDLRHWIALHTNWAQAVDRLSGPLPALEVLDRIGRMGATREHALLESARGVLLFKAGRLHEGARAMEVASRCLGLTAAVRARLLSNAAGAQFHIGSLRSALASWERAALLLERMEARSDLAGTLTNMAVAYEEVGRPERALEAAQRAVELGLASGVAAIAAAALGNLGDLWVARNEHEAALEAWARARVQAEVAGATGELVELDRREAELALEREDERALDLARQARRAALDTNHIIEACRAGALVAVGEARAGQRRRVAALVEEVTLPLQEAGASAALADVRLRLAEALLQVGYEEQARQQVERVLAYADEVGSVRLRSRADAVLLSVGSTEATSDPRLDRLLDLAVEVARERDLPSLLDGIAGAALDLLQAERAFVLLVERGKPAVVASRSVGGTAGGPPSMTIVRRALSGRREVIAGDLGERGDLRNAVSVVTMDLRSVLCVPMLDRGEVQGAIYVDSRTVTEREWAGAARLLRGLAAHAAIAVANARLLQAARERADLAADIAHDLSGPAHVVLCIADEIVSDACDPAQIAHDLRRVGQHVIAMRDRFLSGVEHRAGRLALDGWLDKLGAQLARIARRGGAILEVSAQAAIEVTADAHELERALTNLVRNAVRFSPPGGRVVVSLRRVGRTALLEVADDGPGIPADELTSIFERGVRGRADTSGHGLGLAIAWRIVHSHGGSIACANRPEGGALFTIALPLA